MYLVCLRSLRLLYIEFLLLDFLLLDLPVHCLIYFYLSLSLLLLFSLSVLPRFFAAIPSLLTSSIYSLLLLFTFALPLSSLLLSFMSTLSSVRSFTAEFSITIPYLLLSSIFTLLSLSVSTWSSTFMSLFMLVEDLSVFLFIY